jgi:PhnB protein
MTNAIAVTGFCPYLTVRGAADAIKFYVDAFGAIEDFRLADPTDGRIGHAELMIGSGRFFLSDEYPDFGAVGADTLGGSPIKLHLDVDDVDAFVDRAVKHGAILLRAVKQEFHGHRSGMLGDPFGLSWFVASKTEEVSAAEMQSRWSAMMTGEVSA